MLSVLLVPLRDRRRLVHLLDDVAPAHAGVVRAEGDLAHAGRTKAASIAMRMEGVHRVVNRVTIGPKHTR